MDVPESNGIGYAWLAERFGVTTLPYWKETRVLVKGARRLVERDGREVEYLPAARNPGEDLFAQLEFALKREGLHLELLRKVLPRIGAEEMSAYVRSRPTGRFARLLWWLYEEFSGTRLAVPDLGMGGYVEVLDPAIYVTGPVWKARRQRVAVNLLGTVHFSPMVRKKGLGEWSEETLRERCSEIAGEYPPEIFQRAVRFLYAKESKSSYEIERETPDRKRAEAFIRLLEQAWHRNFLNENALVELHRTIVDTRFANDGWRTEQIYVGETLAVGMERVHFAGPKPEDLSDLMGGFLEMANNIMNRRIGFGFKTKSVKFFEIGKATTHSSVPTLVAAAVISFVFDFLHPFNDGNGRIHRFLLHHVLAHNGFGPDGMILPVSAVILNRPREYDAALESFSKPLMQLVDYTLDDRQRMTVTNDTADFYRYIDCTVAVRVAIEFIRETIESELPRELAFLTNYDNVRRRMREVIELPDRIAELFVRLCRQGDGTLSKRKRKLPEFSQLTDEEIAAMEEIVREVLPESQETGGF